jgi:hypothetical protein
MSTLQRYDMEAMSYSGAWVKEIPSEDGEWVKADEAIALEKELEDERKENKMFIELNAKLTAEAQQLREINTRFLSAIIDVSCPLCGLKKLEER